MIYTEPLVTLIAYSKFSQPDHLQVEWDGEATDGECLIEYAGRLCYMSQNNPAHRTTAKYIENIKKQMHGSVLEHANYSFLIEGISRSLTHELIRHRAGFSYSQLSQRYVNEDHVSFVVPPMMLKLGPSSETYKSWHEHMIASLNAYRALSASIKSESDPEFVKRLREAARSVLPNATETKIVVTANCRAWRTMLELRCGEGADREIQRLGLILLGALKIMVPSVFSDFEVMEDFDGYQYAVPRYHKV